jgi:hypothetical protein
MRGVERLISCKVKRFVDIFFESEPGKRKLGLDSHAEQILARLSEPTPMLCEMVCTCITKDMDIHAAGESKIYSEIISLFWNRAIQNEQVSQIFGRHLESVIRDATRCLQKKSLVALFSGEKTIFLNTEIENGVPKDKLEFLIFNSGMLNSTGESFTGGKIPCRFVNDVFLEYHAALEFLSSEDCFRENLQKFVQLRARERKLLMLVASLMTGKKFRKIFTKILAKKFQEKENTFGSQLSADLTEQGSQYNVREFWRKQLGMDLCVEAGKEAGGRGGRRERGGRRMGKGDSQEEENVGKRRGP